VDKSQCFEVGYITKIHGLDGSVCAVFDVDSPSQFYGIDAIFLEIGPQLVPFGIQRISGQKGNQVIFSFEGIRTEAQAIPLKGCKLFLPEKAFPVLKDDQYYFHELVGCQVKDSNQGLLGTIQEIIDLPHQTLALMVWKGSEVLIPVHPSIVIQLLRKEKQVLTTLPDGLLEVYTEPDLKFEIHEN